MSIRQAHESDLERIAECHISAFPESLSSALGKRYVTKMLGWYLSSEQTFLFFGEDDHRVVGYCGGMIKREATAIGSASGMAQFSFNEAVRAFLMRPWLILHPELRTKYLFIGKNIARRLTGSQRNSEIVTSSAVTSFEPYSALVVIGVRVDAQGKGYGSLLLKEFENRTEKLGFRKMLLTVLTKNSQAIKSYARNGWKKTDVNSKSTTMLKYI